MKKMNYIFLFDPGQSSKPQERSNYIYFLVLAILFYTHLVTIADSLDTLAEEIIELVSASEEALKSQIGGFSIDYALSIFSVEDINNPSSTLKLSNRFEHKLIMQDNKWRREVKGVRVTNTYGSTNDNTSITTYKNTRRLTLLHTGTRNNEDKKYSGHIWTSNNILKSLTYCTFTGVTEGKILSEFLSTHKKEIVNIKPSQKALIIELILNPSSQKMILVLDPEKNYQLKQRLLYDNDEQLTSQMDVEYNNVADGIWIPKKGTIEIFSYNTNGAASTVKKILLDSVNFDTFEYGQDFPDSLFDIDFPDGTFVTDHVTGLRYMIGDAETEMLENLATVSDLFSSKMENTKISQITSGIPVDNSDPDSIKRNNIDNSSDMETVNSERKQQYSRNIVFMSVSSVFIILIGLATTLLMRRLSQKKRSK